MEEGWSIKYLSRWRMTMLLSVAGAAGIIFSAEVEIKSPNFAKGDMHQGVEIKIIYEFLSAETTFLRIPSDPTAVVGLFRELREGPNHQSPSIRPTTSSQQKRTPKIYKEEE
jgi:hypothetical protein